MALCNAAGRRATRVRAHDAPDYPGSRPIAEQRTSVRSPGRVDRRALPGTWADYVDDADIISRHRGAGDRSSREEATAAHDDANAEPGAHS
jgi:hypothetical protein